MDWNIDFISRLDFKKHVEKTIVHYGEKLGAYDLKKFNGNFVDPIKMIFDKAVYRQSWQEVISNSEINLTLMRLVIFIRVYLSI